MKTREDVLQIGAIGRVDPASLLHFFPQLHRRDRLLSQLGWSLIMFAGLFSVLFVTNPVLVGGVNAWIKPIKFNMSFGMYAWTVGWWFGYLRLRAKTMSVLRWSFFVTIAVEIAAIGVQAVRDAVFPHTLTTVFDLALTGTMSTMIFVNTCLVIWMLVIFCQKDHSMAPAYLWAVRLGIVIFLVGNAIGGQMLAQHAHTIGAPDGPSAMPFLNWSTIAGDLRISHFLSIHAIQVLPLIVFVIEAVRPRWSEGRQKLIVFVSAAFYSAFVVATWIEAMLGIPLLRI